MNLQAGLNHDAPVPVRQIVNFGGNQATRFLSGA
jgi:hypothetical protein